MGCVVFMIAQGNAQCSLKEIRSCSSIQVELAKPGAEVSGWKKMTNQRKTLRIEGAQGD